MVSWSLLVDAMERTPIPDLDAADLLLPLLPGPLLASKSISSSMSKDSSLNVFCFKDSAVKRCGLSDTVVFARFAGGAFGDRSSSELYSRLFVDSVKASLLRLEVMLAGMRRARKGGSIG